jgi:hypothetical protein
MPSSTSSPAACASWTFGVTPIPALGQAPHPLVIVQGAVVDDLVAANAETAWGAARGQKQGALVVRSAVITPMEPVSSTSRIPVMAAAAAIPPPMIT